METQNYQLSQPTSLQTSSKNDTCTSMVDLFKNYWWVLLLIVVVLLLLRRRQMKNNEEEQEDE